jgi:dolichyl-phosphate beta-D-mannosyltransferase
MKKVLILIPALNPPRQLIDYVKSLLENGLNDILLVDDGSKEEFKEIFDTIEKFPEANIKVFRHAKNLGKGRALKNAFNYFLNLPNLAEYSGLVTADSDGQHRVEDVINVAKEVEENPDKLILGCRNFNLEQVPPKSRFGNKITSGVFKLFYGKNISDTQTGLRGFPTSIIKDFLDIEGERFEYETKMLLYCFQKEIGIKEVVIETIYFNDNSETHFNPIVDSIKIYKVTLAPFLKYLISATSSFILDILSFKWILAILIAFGSVEGAKVITISTIIARIISSTFNFYLNKKFVFKYEQNTKNSLLKYYSLCIVQMLLSAALVTIVWKYTKYAETSIKIVVDSILFLVSYFIQQRWVFKRK